MIPMVKNNNTAETHWGDLFDQSHTYINIIIKKNTSYIFKDVLVLNTYLPLTLSSSLVITILAIVIVLLIQLSNSKKPPLSTTIWIIMILIVYYQYVYYKQRTGLLPLPSKVSRLDSSAGRASIIRCCNRSPESPGESFTQHSIPDQLYQIVYIYLTWQSKLAEDSRAPIGRFNNGASESSLWIGNGTLRVSLGHLSSINICRLSFRHSTEDYDVESR